MKGNRFFGSVAGIVLAAGLLGAAPARAGFGDTDATFGPTATQGFAVKELGSSADSGVDVVTGFGDRLYGLGVACGSADCATNNAYVVRFDSEGVLDTSFGSTGVLLVDTDVSDAHLEVADGAQLIYIGKRICTATACGVRIQRKDFAAQLDSAWGTSGTVTFPLIGDPAAPANQLPSLDQLLLQPNGKLLAIVTERTASGPAIAIWRFTTDGAADTTWGTNGAVLLTRPSGCIDQLPSASVGVNLAKPVIYVTGAESCTGNVNTPLLVRLLLNGSPDTDFGTDGRVTDDFGTGRVIGFAAQEHSNGSIAYATIAVGGGGADFGIVQLKPDGTLDTSIAEQEASYAVPANFNPAGSSVFQSTGKLVFSGAYATTSSNQDFALQRTGGSPPLFAHPARFTPFVHFTRVADTVGEGDGTTTVSVQLCGADVPTCNPVTSTQAVTVPFSLGGSATEGVDYTVSSTVFTIPANTNSASVTVTIVDDTDQEFDESILFNLGTPTGGAQAGTNNDSSILDILDNDGGPHPVTIPDQGGALELGLIAGLFGSFGLRRIRLRRR